MASFGSLKFNYLFNIFQLWLKEFQFHFLANEYNQLNLFYDIHRNLKYQLTDLI